MENYKKYVLSSKIKNNHSALLGEWLFVIIYFSKIKNNKINTCFNPNNMI